MTERNKRKVEARRLKDNTAKLGYYMVYYLVDENYCGVTDNWLQRSRAHKCGGMNVDNMKVLYTCENRDEAFYTEAMFQGVLGMNGLNYKNKGCL